MILTEKAEAALLALLVEFRTRDPELLYRATRDGLGGLVAAERLGVTLEGLSRSYT